MLGQFGAFAIRHHPTDDVATEDIENHVEIEVRPLDRAAQLGDVPAPDLLDLQGPQAVFSEAERRRALNKSRVIFR